MTQRATLEQSCMFTYIRGGHVFCLFVHMQTDCEVTDTDACYCLRLYRISGVFLAFVTFRLQHLFMRPYFLKQRQINSRQNQKSASFTLYSGIAHVLPPLHPVQRRQMASSCFLLTLFSSMTLFTTSLSVHANDFRCTKRLFLKRRLCILGSRVFFVFFLTGGRKCVFFFLNTHIRVEKCF